jgi:hypothetical protein
MRVTSADLTLIKLSQEIRLKPSIVRVAEKLVLFIKRNIAHHILVQKGTRRQGTVYSRGNVSQYTSHTVDEEQHYLKLDSA